MSSSSVPARVAVRREPANASPVRPEAQRAPMEQYRRTRPAHKGTKLRGYQSIWSRGASLGIRRNLETFSLRYSQAHTKRPPGTLLPFRQHFFDGFSAPFVACARRYTKQKSPGCSPRPAPTPSVHSVLLELGKLSAALPSSWHPPPPYRRATARQPNTQTNSHSSCDDSHRSQNAKMRPGRGHSHRSSRILTLPRSPPRSPPAFFSPRPPPT